MPIQKEDEHLVTEAKDLVRRLELAATGANIHKCKSMSSLLDGCCVLMKKMDGDKYHYWRDKLIETLLSAKELVFPDPVNKS